MFNCKDTSAKIAIAVCNSYEEVAQLIATLPSKVDRLVTVDLAFGKRVVLIQYVDDNVLPASSMAQCCRIWSHSELYSDWHGPAFSLEPGKSVILTVGNSYVHIGEDTPLYRGVAVPVVDEYKHLGILLDIFFTFEPHFRQCMGRMDSSFRKLIGTVNSISMPFVVVSASVPLRVESTGLLGLALCINVPGAEAALNRLQVDWARATLGIDGYLQGQWPFLISETGWKYRLGTRMFCEAIMLEARVLMLPEHSGIVQLFCLARVATLQSWATAVIDLRISLGNVPDILQHFGNRITDRIRTSTQLRRRFVSHYRKSVVLPALRNYDVAAFHHSSQSSDWPYAHFQEPFVPFQDDLLLASWGRHEWVMFQVWSVTRVTGRFAFAFFGLEALPREVPTCPFCATVNADLCHALFECCHHEQARRDLGVIFENWSQFCVYLFGGDAAFEADGSIAFRIRFVYRVTELVAMNITDDDSSSVGS